MAYRLTFRDTFLSDAFRLPRNIQNRMMTMHHDLSEAPEHQRGNIKKLKGYRYLWRYRLDDYRVIYAVVGDCVEYLAAGPRRDIYERFHYDPDNVDEVLSAEVEAALYPDSAAASQVEQRRLWERIAQKQQEQMDPRLPIRLSAEDLQRWGIPEAYHACLSLCRTEGELMDAPVPSDLLGQVIDHVYPATVEVIAERPVRMLPSDQDMGLFVEGKLSSFLLKLDEHQEALVGWGLDGPALVKGGPGSGKSTVAMYRARALLFRAQTAGGPPPTLLFTTFTNALVEYSQQLLSRLLEGLPGSWEVSTVDRVALQLFRHVDSKATPAGRDEWREALHMARSRYRPDLGTGLENAVVQNRLSALDHDYLLDEFEWVIEGRGLDTVSKYLLANRDGRGQALPRPLRRAVWGLYTSARQYLASEGYTSWGAIRSRALALARQQAASRWDYVIVDEAQDLTPVALGLCVELTKDPRHIFLAADSSQSIYHRGFSYSKVHEALDVAHRTRCLRRNYRSTREIAQAALEIVHRSGAGDEEALIQESLHFGPKPVLATAVGVSAQVERIVEYIRHQARTLGLPTGAAAILCPTNALAQQVASLCTTQKLPARYMPGRDLKLEVPEVKVLTIHSAKGLEFPIVAVACVDDGTLPRPLPPSSPDDPHVHEQHERRIFFVGATRAMRRLIVTSSGGDKLSPFLADLTPKAWDME